MSKKIAFFTLGCRVNNYESTALEDSARFSGYTIVNWGEPADIAVVNSCALTILAEAKTRQAVRIFARNNPDSAIAITGCYAQTSPLDLLKLENVKWVIGNSLKARTIDIINTNPPMDFPHIFVDKTITSSKETICANSPLTDRMNLKIQDGCDNACSYCIIPRARGLPRSRNFDEIIADAENMVSRGVRELIITGINISKFSSQGKILADLTDSLNNIKDLLRIRIGSIEPPDFGVDALLERIADTSHKLCPHLHISSQSLSDNVLSAMRRKYTSTEFFKMLEKIRNSAPNISVGTDIICGHPYETEEDFAQTRTRLADSGMSYAHVFTYSQRPKTLAEKMPQVPVEIRKERANTLREDAKKLHSDFIKKNSNKPIQVLLENEVRQGTYLAYTDNYIQTEIEIGESGLKNRLALVEIESTTTNDDSPVKAKFLNLQ